MKLSRANWRYISSFAWMHGALMIFVFAPTVGCGDPVGKSERVKREKEKVVEDAEPLYQVGCDLSGVCKRKDVICGQEAVQNATADVRAGERVVVRYIDSDSVHVALQIWAVQEGQKGRYFTRDDSDVRGTGCEDYCGWHTHTVGAAEVGPNGRLLLPNGRGRYAIEDAVGVECSDGQPAREPK